jgi:hypothetical protein
MTNMNKPHPLVLQAGRLRSQIQLAEGVCSIAEALLSGMLTVPEDDKIPAFQRQIGRAAIEEILEITRSETKLVKDRLTALLETCTKNSEMPVEEANAIDTDITGRAIAQINRLGNVGPNLVKSLEHLPKLSPTALGDFVKRVADSMRLLPNTATE